MMNQQQQLLNTIWSDKPASALTSHFNTQGINVYRRNLFASAQRSLTITFPTIFKLLDSDIAERITHDFIKFSPPRHGDWSQWGADFSQYLSTDSVADDYPFLPDCAKVDWLIHCVLQGKDQVLNQASLQLLNEQDPENIAVEFNPNVVLLKTKYPVTEIYDAHHHCNLLSREASMAEAKYILSGELTEQIVMIFRPEFLPKIVKLTASESEFMISAMSEKSLFHSLTAITDERNFSFEQWLIIAIERNLIHNFKEI